MKLEQQITIMGGKHTLPRCQHYKTKQCGKPTQKGKQYCAAHVSTLRKNYLHTDTDIDASDRKLGWSIMCKQAKASVRKFFGQEYRARQRKIVRAVD